MPLQPSANYSGVEDNHLLQRPQQTAWLPDSFQVPLLHDQQAAAAAAGGGRYRGGAGAGELPPPALFHNPYSRQPQVRPAPAPEA